MKTVLLDIDGVLADFVYGFTSLAHDLFDSKVLHTDDQKSWDDLGLTKEQMDKVWDMINHSTNFWRDLPPLAPAYTFKRISRLSFWSHVVFCTNRQGVFNPQLQTVQWLVAHGIQYPNVILSKRKGEVARAIDADFAIDDKPENVCCIHWIADTQPCRAFVIDRPYNRDPIIPRRVTRVMTVEGFLNEVEK